MVFFLTGLVRDCSLEVAQEQFVAHNGFGVLKKVLEAQGPFKRVAKVAFFLTVMCERSPPYKGKKLFIEMLSSQLVYMM